MDNKMTNEAFEVENTLIPAMPSNLMPNRVYFTDDKDFIARRANEMFAMLQKGYADKDGLIVDNANDLIRLSDFVKFVFDSDQQILAHIIYRRFAGGKKLFLGAAKKNVDGKNAIQEIIKTDIEPYDNWFWGEVSGPIEHYFKKHNGRPVPKELAAKFLKKKNIVVSPDENDPVHYTRQIADLPNPIEKAIYGFKDEAMAKEVMESIDNYEDFRIEVNSMPDKINENEFSNGLLEDALAIIVQIADMHEEFGFNEMLPHWHKAVINAITYMKQHINDIADHEKLKQTKSSINMGEYLCEKMPLLTLKKFKAPK